MNIERLESIDCGVSEPTTEELAEFIAAYNELKRLKYGLTLHPSVMTQQNVAMLAFKYDEVKQDLAAKIKLIDAIWTVVRKHGYEYGPLNEAVGQMVHDSIEQREELKKENADLKRDKDRLDWLEAHPSKEYTPILLDWRGNLNLRAVIDAAQAKEGAQ